MFEPARDERISNQAHLKVTVIKLLLSTTTDGNTRRLFTKKNLVTEKL